MQKRPTAALVMGTVLALAFFALIFGLQGCSRPSTIWGNCPGKRVVVTIPALDNFVRNVGGDHICIHCLCTTEGPHQYTYNPPDAMILKDADLFFAVGLTLDEKFADPIQRDSHNPHLRYVQLGERLPANLKRANEEKHEHDEKEHGHDHEHGDYDPHVWLGIPQAIGMVEIIRDELKKLDPDHADDFDKNADTYIKRLKKLHTDGKAKLRDKKNRKIIAFHESLGYFAKSFDLNIVDVLEVTPGSEPSPSHMVQVVKKCKAEDVHVIAVEPQYPVVSSAKVLEQQVKKIQFVVVDPLETVNNEKELKESKKELKDADWYERKMRQNLDELARGLP